jgi:hypothetical protein
MIKLLLFIIALSVLANATICTWNGSWSPSEPSTIEDTAVWEGSSNWTASAGFTSGKMVARPTAYIGNLDFGTYSYTTERCSLSTGGAITAAGLFTINADANALITCTGTLTATSLNIDFKGTGSFTSKSTVDTMYLAYAGKTVTLLGNVKFPFPQSATGTTTVGTTFISSPDKNYTWNQSGGTLNGSGYWTFQNINGTKITFGKLDYTGTGAVLNIRNSHYSGTDTIETTDSIKILANTSPATFNVYKGTGYKHRFILGGPMIIGRNYTTVFGNNNATDTNFMSMGNYNHFFGAGLNDSTYNAGRTIITTSDAPVWTVNGNLLFGSNTQFNSSGLKIVIDTTARIRTAGITRDTIVFDEGAGFSDRS